MNDLAQELTKKIDDIKEVKFFGSITKISGLLAECQGIGEQLSIASRVKIHSKTGNQIIAEVVGFDGDKALIMPFTGLDGVGVEDKVEIISSDSAIYPSEAWLGRVVNSFGEAIDDKGALSAGEKAYNLKNSPPPANERNRVEGKIDLGVKAMNAFTTCCLGQRMGIFAGSGVGKSMLMSMIAKYSSADVNIIGLVGERGREVQEFIEDYLGPEGMKRTVVVVATSDESALCRKYAAFTTMAIAEYFRDQGKDVFCMIDSVTRFAMAQREIGLSAGEPPTSKGYTPSVFAELPRLLERAGPGTGKGSITGLFSVLVEGDDHDEPIADAVRGILDGHIVMSRKIAERGRFPAIDILKSVSRMMPNCNAPEENQIVNQARQLLSTYEDMAEMIRLGAYKAGSDPMVDTAIQYYPKIEAFVAQDVSEQMGLDQGYYELAKALDMIEEPAPEAPDNPA